MHVKYYTGRTVSNILIDALANTSDEGFWIIRGILDRFAATDTEIVNCEHYKGACCTRFGKSAIPRRNSDDFCSYGERRK